MTKDKNDQRCFDISTPVNASDSPNNRINNLCYMKSNDLLTIFSFVLGKYSRILGMNYHWSDSVIKWDWIHTPTQFDEFLSFQKCICKNEMTTTKKKKLKFEYTVPRFMRYGAHLFSDLTWLLLFSVNVSFFGFISNCLIRIYILLSNTRI